MNRSSSMLRRPQTADLETTKVRSPCSWPRSATSEPRALAQEIAARIDFEELGPRPEVAGGGFINFKLHPHWLTERLKALTADERLGCPPSPPRHHGRGIFLSQRPAKDACGPYPQHDYFGDSLCRIGNSSGIA